MNVDLTLKIFHEILNSNNFRVNQIMDSVSLAESRRRVKWSTNPRGTLWSNDETKFGQKLLEKMGWSKGKGLGSKEDGRVQHISLKHKDNNKGIGFEGYDDKWLDHQNDFQVRNIFC